MTLEEQLAEARQAQQDANSRVIKLLQQVAQQRRIAGNSFTYKNGDTAKISLADKVIVEFERADCVRIQEFEGDDAYALASALVNWGK